MKTLQAINESAEIDSNCSSTKNSFNNKNINNNNNNNNSNIITTDELYNLKTNKKNSADTSSVRNSASSSATASSSSYVIKCLVKTVRFMWQVTAIPAKLGETIGTIYRYAQDSVDTFLCVAGKARRKERDGDQNSTDTKLYLEESVLERKLPEADLKALVDLPAGLDYNEWLASHTLALFEHVNLVYGTISEFCTPSGCADMTGPGNRTYLWFDEKGKKTRVAAPQYIDYVMTFTQKTVSDESIFPTKYANEFPSSFESIARKILRLQFHVIAHLYAAHFREIALLGLHTHLNLTFAHLTALHRRFNLIDEKETDVLRDLEVALRLTDDNNTAAASATTATTTGSNSSSSSCQQQQQQQNSQSQHEISTAAASAAAAALGSQTTTTATVETNITEQQQQHNSSHTTATTTITTNLEQQHVNSATTTATAAGSLIDGDANAPPICTQPESAATITNNSATATHPIFGTAGGGGLMGGILGDLTSGEFGDTTRYCTSAVPQATAAMTTTSLDTAAAAASMSNNGAGALHLNFNNHNKNNNHHYHHHHHHNYHHNHHHHQHPHAHAAATAAGVGGQLQQNSGLIQCNAVGGVSNNTAAAAANNSSTTTTTA